MRVSRVRLLGGACLSCDSTLVLLSHKARTHGWPAVRYARAWRIVAITPCSCPQPLLTNLALRRDACECSSGSGSMSVAECNRKLMLPHRCRPVDQLRPARLAAGQGPPREVVHNARSKAEGKGRQGCDAARVGAENAHVQLPRVQRWVVERHAGLAAARLRRAASRARL